MYQEAGNTDHPRDRSFFSPLPASTDDFAETVKY